MFAVGAALAGIALFVLLFAVLEREPKRPPEAAASVPQSTAPPPQPSLGVAASAPLEPVSTSNVVPSASPAASGSAPNDMPSEEEMKAIKQLDKNRDPKENLATNEQSIAMLDKIIPIVEADLKKAEADGDTAKAKRLAVRLERLRAERTARAADAGSGDAAK